MNALALSLTPSVSSNETFLIKGLLWRKGGEGGGGGLKGGRKTNRGGGGGGGP